ncbi:MAG: c-type cytochrome [Melioribacteraceae bacterium]|nr:c-type cytochrome [Melioribacteraceae bacterium]
MKNFIKNKIVFTIILLLSISVAALAQIKWEVPKKDNDKISFQMFNEDMANDGRLLYELSCASCHGVPTETNYALMVPSPGDPADEVMQNQTDGSLFYKIAVGRDQMPKFEDVLAEDEIWNIVAYFRSFNPSYIQPIPDLDGIVIPEFDVELAYDENVDKLVVKVKADGSTGLDVEVSAFIKTMFGKYALGKTLTNSVGIAYFDVDSKIPGDSLGYLTTIVKVKKGYGFKKVTEKLQMGTPTTKISAIAGRHLWSTDDNAPFWLDFIFHATIIFIWGAMFIVIYQLRKLKKVV